MFANRYRFFKYKLSQTCLLKNQIFTNEFVTFEYKHAYGVKFFKDMLARKYAVITKLIWNSQ